MLDRVVVTEGRSEEGGKVALYPRPEWCAESTCKDPMRSSLGRLESAWSLWLEIGRLTRRTEGRLTGRRNSEQYCDCTGRGEEFGFSNRSKKAMGKVTSPPLKIGVLNGLTQKST